MKKQNRKSWKTILVVPIAICIIIAAAFLLLIAPAFVETTIPADSYVIEITGLSGHTVNGTATVMVPIPANAYGDLVIPKDVLTGHQVEGWQAAVRETPYGKMLAFTTTEEYAPNIFVPFGERETKEEPRLLMPVLATPGNRSVGEFSRLSNGTYTTVVFIDGFAPPPEAATPISFTLEYRGGAGMKHLVKEDIWTATVDTSIKITESGFVRVPAEYQVISGGIYF